MEIVYVQQAFESNWISTVGPNLTSLEEEFSRFIGLPAVALGSGTAAIHLGLKLLGVKAGDEVVVPTLTFAATVNPVLYEKAVPVFVDSDRATWNLDPNLLADFLKQRAAVNKLPKAVIVVHLFGQSADMDSIMDICNRYEVPVLEDAAEALGALYKGKHPGTMGQIGIYSFNGNKIITSSGGGMLVAQDKKMVEKARYWSTQARDPDPDLNNYLHSEVGYNYRLSNVLAGIARGQLLVLPQRVRERRAVAMRYRDALRDIPGLEMMPQASFNSRETSLHTNWLSCFLVDQEAFGLSQSELLRFLDAANIEARPVWKPMHTQALYKKYKCVGGSVAKDLNHRGICLPSSSSLSLEDQNFVIDRIKEAHIVAANGRRPSPEPAVALQE
jgi:pyridoxal phosphate-dependent aminotransferase EpsN